MVWWEIDTFSFELFSSWLTLIPVGIPDTDYSVIANAPKLGKTIVPLVRTMALIIIQRVAIVEGMCNCFTDVLKVKSLFPVNLVLWTGWPWDSHGAATCYRMY